MASRTFSLLRPIREHLVRGSHALAGEFVKLRADVETTFSKMEQEASGTTGQRPARPFRGQRFFDTTLVEDLVWNGAAWVSNATSPTPTVVGVDNGQSLNSTDLFIRAETVDAATVTVDTGYIPASGVLAKLDGAFSGIDIAHDKAFTKNFNELVINAAGTPRVPTDHAAIVSGSVGDNALATCAVTFAITSGTLHVTFTPPSGYSGTIRWLMDLSATEN